MKKSGIINQNLITVIAGMGHTDKLVICDAGLPIPEHVERVDLSLEKGYMPLVIVLESILKELEVEKAYIAEETAKVSPEIYRAMKSKLGDINIEEISHEELKRMTANSKGVVRTGECTAYANIILQSGVKF